MPVYAGNKKAKLFIGNTKVKKGYVGNTLVYSAGNIVTYHVDIGVVYQEEVEDGQTVLSPTSFTPTKSGWSFVGWTNSATNHTPIQSMVMGDDPINLYAIFSQNVTLTTIASGSTSNQTKPRKYNNNTIANPQFTVANPSASGGTFKGWSASSGSASISYSTINNTTFSSSTTLYSVITYPNAELTFEYSTTWSVPDHWGESNAPDIPCYPAIDCSKYSGFTGTIYGYLEANGSTGNCAFVIGGGGSEVQVAHSYWDGGKIVDDDFRNPYKNVSLTFTQKSGMTNIYLGGRLYGYHASNSGVFWFGDAHSNKGPITLIGRTAIG